MADIIEWNDTVLAEYLIGAGSEVLYELLPKVEALAITLAPVRVRHTPVPPWVRQGHGRSRGLGHGGALKASVHSEITEYPGGIYGDVIALWYGRFMDPKARQLHYLRPFLPTALYTICQGRVLEL